ncbi:MAG: hypothetical protein ABEJ69_01320 [Candidatus Nanohaloarchaea archaeon]
MDGKILSAVFVSLAAIAAGINGGSLQPADIKNADLNKPTESSLTDFIPNSMQFLNQFLEKPKPEKQVRFVVSSADGEVVKVRNAELSIQNYTRYRSETLTIDSDEPIVFKGFSGKISLKNQTSFQGRVSGYRTSGVNVTQGLNVKSGLEGGTVNLEGVHRVGLSFEDATVEIESESTSTTVKNNSLTVNSFSGSITSYTGNGTFVFVGKIDRMQAGDIVLKAE